MFSDHNLLVPAKCDKRIRFEWNQEVKKQEALPDLDAFLKFIDAFCKAEEQALSSTSVSEKPKSSQDATKSIQSTQRKKKLKAISTPATVTKEVKQQTQVREKKYLYCDAVGHHLTVCEKFKELPVKDRVEIIAQKKLCVYCLRPHCNPNQ